MNIIALRMQMKVKMKNNSFKITPKSLWNRVVRTGNFYVFIAAFIIISWVLWESDKEFTNILIPFCLYPLGYLFYTSRSYIYSIEIIEGKIEIEWINWFKTKREVFSISDINASIQNVYRLKGTTLIIKSKRATIFQSETGEWNKELQEEILNFILAEKNRSNQQ